MAEDGKRAAFIERLRAAASKLQFLTKDGTNAHFNYAYVTEASVKRAVRAALAECGLAITAVRAMPMDGATPTAAVVVVTITVGDESGEEASFEGIGADQDKSGKAAAKAEAMAYKYAFLHGFAIPTGDGDPEANKEADEIGEELRVAEKSAKRAPRKAAADKDAW